MGLILQCHALSPDTGAGAASTLPGVLLGSVSIDSDAVEALLGPLADGPLAFLDFAAGGPTGVRVDPGDLIIQTARLAVSGVDANILNTISDAADEALARQSWLWIGLA